MKIYAQGRKGADFDHGIEAAVEAVLVSPDFLFMRETDPAKSAPGDCAPHQRPGTGDAAVLLPVEQPSPTTSCCRWPSTSSCPSPAVLKAQVARMLADPQAQGADREFRRPVAVSAPAGIPEARSPRLPGFRRAPARGDEDRDRDVLRRRGARKSQRAGLPGRQLHLSQPAPGRALRHPRRLWHQPSARSSWTRRCIAAACWARARS